MPAWREEREEGGKENELCKMKTILKKNLQRKDYDDGLIILNILRSSPHVLFCLQGRSAVFDDLPVPEMLHCAAIFF